MYFPFAWLLSFCTIILRFIHAVSLYHSSFLLLSTIPLNGYTTICLSMHLLMDIWFVFQKFGIINKAAVNILVGLFVWT